MQLHNQPQSNFDPPGALAPWLWYGSAALDGAALPFCDAPQGSMYWYLQSGTVTVYFRAALNNATADWVQVLQSTATTQTITGNLTVSGTVTAGDFVGTAG